ncbi:MAG: hypothetical protein IKR40_09345 [Treponema sp.]|nr:hypothetical protein [Treponema sp.]
MEIKKFIYIFLCAILPFCFLSCSYKESLKNKIFVYNCNYTDLQVELRLSWGNKKSQKVLVPQKTLKCATYKFGLKEAPDYGQVILLYKGETLETRSLKFPGEGLYSYSAYGGLFTRINVLLDDDGYPFMEINSDLDP